MNQIRLIKSFWCLLLFIQVCLAANKPSRKENKGKKKRPNCGFYRFLPLPALTFAALEAEIVNKKQENETYKIALNCPTLKLIEEPKMSHTLKPGQKEIILFKMIVDKNEVHTSPELLHHKCVITRWSEKSNALDMCPFDVSVWPYGLFDYPCDDYVEGQLTFTRKPEKNNVVVINMQDSTTKLGLFSVYMLNLTCSPRLPLIEQIETISKLRKEKPWKIEIPANCSGVLRQNYVGLCQVEIFNLCHTQITQVVNTTFQLYDGETDECEYLKERLGDLSDHPLAAFFGLNYVETGYLTVVVLAQVLLILLTAVVIRIRKRQLAARKRK